MQQNGCRVGWTDCVLRGTHLYRQLLPTRAVVGYGTRNVQCRTSMIAGQVVICDSTNGRRVDTHKRRRATEIAAIHVCCGSHKGEVVGHRVPGKVYVATDCAVDWVLVVLSHANRPGTIASRAIGEGEACGGRRRRW